MRIHVAIIGRAANENYAPRDALASSRFWSCFLDEWQGAATLAIPAYCILLGLIAMIWAGTIAALPFVIASGLALTYTIRRILTEVPAPATPHKITEALWRRIAS